MTLSQLQIAGQTTSPGLRTLAQTLAVTSSRSLPQTLLRQEVLHLSSRPLKSEANIRPVEDVSSEGGPPDSDVRPPTGLPLYRLRSEDTINPQVEVILCVTSSTACLSVGGLCLLDEMLEALSSCHLLLPSGNNLWIVCPAILHSAVWACCQHSGVVGCHISPVLQPVDSMASCLKYFLQGSADMQLDSQSALLVLDACCFCSWPTGLQRFSTHSLLRNELCIACATGASWVGSADARFEMTLVENNYNSRVTAVHHTPCAAPQPCGQSRNAEALLCPLFHIPARHQAIFFGAATQASGLVQLVQTLLTAVVYSLPLSGCLWAAGSDGLKLLQAYGRIVQAIRQSSLAGRVSGSANAKQSVEEAGLERLSKILQLDPAADVDSIQPTSSKVARQPPAVQLAAQEHWPRRQHPVYSTSNNAYGSKAPSLHELPLSWHGIRGEFTRKQATGKVVTTGLKTAISNHAVSDILHEIGL